MLIGRGGSSLKNKNILPVKGIPLLLWGCSAAHRSKYINHYYVSSDDANILDTAGIAGYKPILRPDELASDTAQSSDAVRHALKEIEHDIGHVDIIVVQHANVGTITEKMIDECIEKLLSNPLASSVVPAHEYSEYHPMRAKKVTKEGYLESFFTGQKVSANRQDLPQAVFFDHSFWVLKGREAVFDPNGQGPWPCMGSNILPYINKGCFDVHTLEDLETTGLWIDENGVLAPDFEQL
ncbi:acylneuraminate cytidylyltransferase family protein [Cobetia marina]